MRRRFLALIIASLLPALGMAQSDHLTILSPHWEGIRFEFEWAFQDYYRTLYDREISITWLDAGGTSEILRFIRSEFRKKPDGIDVDLFFGGGVEPYVELNREGLLEPYKLPPPELQSLPPDIAGAVLYDRDFAWYAPVIGGFGIMCNNDVVRLLKLRPPAQWADLTDAQYHSWLSSSDPRKSGSSHMIYEILLQAYGWEEGLKIIHMLARNIREFSAASNQPAKDAEAGESACSFAYDSQAWFAQKQHGKDHITFTMPEGHTVLAPDAAAILKGAPSRDAARTFMRFLFSMKAQRLWILPHGSPGGPLKYDLARMPVVPAVYEEPGDKLTDFNPFLWRNEFSFDSTKASLRWNVLNDLLGAFIIEPHPTLREISHDAPFPEFPAETEVLSLAPAWQDPLERDARLSVWRSQALLPYGRRGGHGNFLLLLPWLCIAAAIVVFRIRRWRQK